MTVHQRLSNYSPWPAQHRVGRRIFTNPNGFLNLYNKLHF